MSLTERLEEAKKNFRKDYGDDVRFYGCHLSAGLGFHEGVPTIVALVQSLEHLKEVPKTTRAKIMFLLPESYKHKGNEYEVIVKYDTLAVED